MTSKTRLLLPTIYRNVVDICLRMAFKESAKPFGSPSEPFSSRFFAFDSSVSGMEPARSMVATVHARPMRMGIHRFTSMSLDEMSGPISSATIKTVCARKNTRDLGVVILSVDRIKSNFQHPFTHLLSSVDASVRTIMLTALVTVAPPPIIRQRDDSHISFNGHSVQATKITTVSIEMKRKCA